MITRLLWVKCSVMGAAVSLLLTSAFAQDVSSGEVAASLRMNDIQVVGSHNSFKAQIPNAVMAKLRATDAEQADSLDYFHISLTKQLDAGVRQFELDIFADPQGGRYANPKGEVWARAAGEATGFDPAAMRQPGFKVFHTPDVDYLSSCPTLIACLGEIDRWSRAHPDHLPIMRSEEHTSELQSRPHLVCRLLLEKK